MYEACLLGTQETLMALHTGAFQTSPKARGGCWLIGSFSKAVRFKLIHL